MSAEISQKEYLKKYLSGSDVKKKKKKQKINSSSLKRSQIIDDDIDLKNMRMLNDDEVDVYQLDEDAPQIAGIIDERPDEVKSQEYYNSKRWKVFSTDNDSDSIRVVERQKNNHLESSENYLIESTKEISVKSQKINIDEPSHSKKVKENKHLVSDIRNNSDSDQSLPRQTIKCGKIRYRESVSDSDLSPPRTSKADYKRYSENSKYSYSRGNNKSRIISKDKNASDDSDLSPPRTSRSYDKRDSKNSKCNNKNRIIHKDKSASDDSDLSPPRTSKSEYKRDSENSKYSYSKGNNKNRITRKDESDSDDSDLSPPRKSQSGYNRDLENSKYSHSSKGNYKSRINRKDKSASDDSDLSPPRKSKSDYKRDSKNSKYSYSQDNSKNKNRRDDSDFIPPRKVTNERNTLHRTKERNKSDSDLSPPRKSDKNNRYSQSKDKISRHDNSRRQHNDSDSAQYNWPRGERGKREEKYYSNKHREKRSASGSPNNNRKFSRQQEYRNTHSRSPSRKTGLKEFSKSKRENSDSDLSPSRNSHDRNTEAKQSKMERTLDGKRAGLQDAQNLKKELADFKKKEDQLFSKMNSSVSGEGAAPVLRDRKTGRIRDLEVEKIVDKEKAAKDDLRKEKYSRWGKGLKQVEDAAERLADAMKEMSKPLARYADDEDLDKFLRAQEREGDPMLDYIRRKQSESVALTGRKPQYQGAYAPNRFGIRPGHRWDGVDRSNGFEKKWFTQQNSRKARDEEAYKWSTSDM